MISEQMKALLSEVRPSSYLAAGLVLGGLSVVLSDPAARQVLTALIKEQRVVEKLLRGVQAALE